MTSCFALTPRVRVGRSAVRCPPSWSLFHPVRWLAGHTLVGRRRQWHGRPSGAISCSAAVVPSDILASDWTAGAQ